jgi:GH15 family glucan-1,4-alpha-glucosidase
MNARVGRSNYPPISDYALIADCHSSALVSKSGSIDWCCMPRFDSDSCFGRLLDWDMAGYFAISPSAPDCQVEREYEKDTLILVTNFRVAEGEARLRDFFAMREGGRLNPRRELIRILEGISGALTFSVEVIPRLDYGEIKPWIFTYGSCAHAAVGSSDGLVICGDVPLAIKHGHQLDASVTVRPGERFRLSIQFVSPEALEDTPPELPDPSELDRRFQETRDWWHQWSKRIVTKDSGGACVMRSAIVLKALEYAPTGAIVAAPTTSLPEAIGGKRNWDYRYSWVRDSIFTVHSLADLGCEAEADSFRRFLQRSAAGDADQLQVLYGVDGRRRLTEIELDFLEGYSRTRPVRIGNHAACQFQADVYGLMLELAWRWAERGNSPDANYWKFLSTLVETAIRRWPEPDRGIWEIRSEPQHFVHSKVMCWAAVNRGIALSQSCGLEAPVESWSAAREEIRAAVEFHGYDSERGIFVQAFGMKEVDAALLLLPDVEFVDYRDERMIRTTDAIRSDLNQDGLILRYRTRDGVGGPEGVFLACSFWLAECLARQGRCDEARRVFDRAMACANDVGLFAEEYDSETGQMLGNFPQGLSHLAHISAALALEREPPARSRKA